MNPAGSVRLFVALELPAAVRGALSAWAQDHAGGLAGLRRVGPESLHVTLCFLGSRPATEVDPIASTCRAAVSGLSAVELTVGEPLWLPPRRPRVLTVELTDDQGRLTAIQAALATALANAGLYKRERRPFLAHVTVARVKGETRPRRPELPAPNETRFTSHRITLFESHLGHGPAQYEALSSTDLS